jgi:hypothetical protein
MKDIQKYNQKLLAIIGTLILATLAIILIVVAVEFIGDLTKKKARRSPQGIVINQDQVVDTNTFSFSQEISILEPYQLDSIKLVFIVPIGQKDQKTKRIDLITAGLDFESIVIDDYHYSSFSGLYNNFVLIDYTRNIRIPIFNSKIALTEWAYMKIDSAQLILFKGTDKDLNKDGRLNDDDFQSLYVFDIATLKIKEFSFKNQTVIEFEPLSKTNKIYVRTGKDINNDNEFDSYKEPTDLYFYNVSTGESETMVPEDVKKKIQKILSK